MSSERFATIGLIERKYRQRIEEHGDLARLDNLLEECWEVAVATERKRCAEDVRERVRPKWKAIMLAAAILKGDS